MKGFTKETDLGASEDNEINDMDLITNDGQTQLSVCLDDGTIHLLHLNQGTLELEKTQHLQHKHTNICLRCQFSNNDPNILYSLGFDYKVIMWHLRDVSNKS